MSGRITQPVRDFPGWEPTYPGTVLQADCPSTYATVKTARYETSHGKIQLKLSWHHVLRIL